MLSALGACRHDLFEPRPRRLAAHGGAVVKVAEAVCGTQGCRSRPLSKPSRLPDRDDGPVSMIIGLAGRSPCALFPLRRSWVADAGFFGVKPGMPPAATRIRSASAALRIEFDL